MAAAERAGRWAGFDDVLGAAHSSAHATGEGGGDLGDVMHCHWANAPPHFRPLQADLL